MLRIRLSITSILGVVLFCAMTEAQQPEQVLPEEARKRLEHAIGKWNFVTKIYNRFGDVTREVHGTDSNRYIISGRVVQHTNEIPATKSMSKGMMFYSFRDEKFYMTSVDTNGDLWILSGGLDKYVLTSRARKRHDGSESMIRFVHENIQPDSFEAKMEFSRDGGKTWRTSSRQYLTRVKSADVPSHGTVERATRFPNDEDVETTVVAFEGGTQPLTKTVQFLITGPRDSVMTTMAGRHPVNLPHRLNLPADSSTARFRIVGAGAGADDVYFASLTASPSSAAARAFVEANAIAVTIDERFLASASSGIVTQFIFLPRRPPTEKWSGRLGTLVMGRVARKQRDEVLTNLRRRGHLLAELQITAQDLATDDALPSFPDAATPHERTGTSARP